MKLTYLSTRETSARVLDHKGIRILFSYETPVALFEQGKLFVDSKFYSMTTSRHINLFRKLTCQLPESGTKLPSHELLQRIPF